MQFRKGEVKVKKGDKIIIIYEENNPQNNMPLIKNGQIVKPEK